MKYKKVEIFSAGTQGLVFFYKVNNTVDTSGLFY